MRMLKLTVFLLAAIFSAVSALAQEAELAGGEWELAEPGGAPAAVLRFDAGRVFGTGGCNRFSGRYEQSGSGLSFSPLVATRMACAPDVMQREQAFFAMLRTVRKLSLSGDSLTLLDAAGGALATFTRPKAE